MRLWMIFGGVKPIHIGVLLFVVGLMVPPIIARVITIVINRDEDGKVTSVEISGLKEGERIAAEEEHGAGTGASGTADEKGRVTIDFEGQNAGDTVKVSIPGGEIWSGVRRTWWSRRLRFTERNGRGCRPGIERVRRAAVR